jgi:hypothetical protein
MTRKFTALAAIIVLAVLGYGAFAQDTSFTTALIKRDLYKNFDDVQDSAKKLDESQRNAVYNLTAKDPASDGLLGAGVNFFAGFGIGSFVMGDKSGGVLGLCLDLAVVPASIGVVVLALYGDWSYEVVYIAYIAACALPTISRAIQIIRPFAFITRYNNDLADALLLSMAGVEDADLSLALLPGRNGLPCPGVSLTVRI